MVRLIRSNGPFVNLAEHDSAPLGTASMILMPNVLLLFTNCVHRGIAVAPNPAGAEWLARSGQALTPTEHRRLQAP